MGNLNSGLFTSETDQWATPQWLFDEWAKRFNFTLDVCALPENHKCDTYFSPDVDGLTQSWSGNICWMNPPYGREIGKWVEKAYLQSKAGACVVCLLPARTDTRWFHDYCLPYGEVIFIKGRLKFGDAKNSAPFPSMMVVFRMEIAHRLTPIAYRWAF